MTRKLFLSAHIGRYAILSLVGLGATLVAAVGACGRSPLLGDAASNTLIDGGDGGSGAGGGEGGRPIDPNCGDGKLDNGEACDDGNNLDGDGCSATCELSDCGNGVLDLAEECDEGLDNEDSPALLLQQGSLSVAVRPVIDLSPSFNFYNYYSESAHTGFESPSGSRLFLLQSATTQSLSIFAIHGIDEGPPAAAEVRLEIAGVPSSAFLVVQDDPGGEQDNYTQVGSTLSVKWEYFNNTDGLVLDNLPFPGDWSMAIDPNFVLGVSNWGYVDGDEAVLDLALNLVTTLTSASQPNACRRDCTVPVCGDGILDAGEFCDGPSCSSDCSFVDL